jgi:type II secretory pathway pseudopilin PulG
MPRNMTSGRKSSLSLRGFVASWLHGSRAAFSLTEMLVAIAVLIVALAVVTNVFSITAKTAATSQAIAEVEAALQRFFADFEADMKGINPAESVLVIGGRTQAAARTEDLRQAGRYYRVLIGDPTIVPANYNPSSDPTQQPIIPGNSVRDQFSDPRADTLMTFTTTARQSHLPTSAALNNVSAFNFQRGLQRGAKVSPVQVVYGHASFGTPTRNSNGIISFPAAAGIKHIETRDGTETPRQTISEIPLNRWVLGVRRTLIDDPSVGESRIAGPANYPIFKNISTENESGGNAASRRDTWDRITQGYAQPGSNNANFAVDSATFRLRDFLTFFSPRQDTSGTYSGLPEPRGLALADPYDLVLNRRWNAQNGALRSIIDNIMYYPEPRSTAHHHVLTLADKPMPELSANQAMAALPGCAWFQVEFLMPEDPRNSLMTPVSGQRDDMPRWVEVEPGKTYAFVPDSQENRALIASQTNPNGTPLVGSQWDRLNTFAQVIPPMSGAAETWQPTGALNRSSNRRIRTWPYAIRITVRVFDIGGKLEEPITRTFIHRFAE